MPRNPDSLPKTPRRYWSCFCCWCSKARESKRQRIQEIYSPQKLTNIPCKLMLGSDDSITSWKKLSLLREKLVPFLGKFFLGATIQGGPLPVISGVITHKYGEITPVSQLFPAIKNGATLVTLQKNWIRGPA